MIRNTLLAMEIATIAGAYGLSQTYTFPSSGNVGIDRKEPPAPQIAFNVRENEMHM